MNIGINIFIIVWLGMLSVIDLRYKKIPAFMSTTFLLTTLILFGEANLYVGIIAFVMGLLIIDLGFMSGEADLKLFSGLGVVVGSQIFSYLILVVGLGIVYKIIYKKIIKPKEDECAFIPVFLVTYLVMLFSHLIG